MKKKSFVEALVDARHGPPVSAIQVGERIHQLNDPLTELILVVSELRQIEHRLRFGDAFASRFWRESSSSAGTELVTGGLPSHHLRPTKKKKKK